MFARRFFAGRYFAPVYFPQSQGGAPPVDETNVYVLPNGTWERFNLSDGAWARFNLPDGTWDDV